MMATLQSERDPHVDPVERADEGCLELITFEIAGQEFCIDIKSVREIRGWTRATPSPQAADYVHGLINLRGMIMPVIDLRMRLGLGRTEPTSRHVIVVVHHDGRVAGLLVDAVQETLLIDAATIQSPPLDAAAEPPLVDGVIPSEARMISHLVVGALLTQAGSLAA